MVQLGSACMLFITSALINWYQGSNLIDDPDEWKYSAKFTNYFKGTVSNYEDIYQIDSLYICSKILSNSIYRYASEFTLYAHINFYILFKKKRCGVLNPYIKTPNHKLFSLQFGVLFVYIRFGLVTN